MHVAGLAYSLGGISLALSVIATVVHGVCIASARSISSTATSMESVTVALSAISCMVIGALMLNWTRGRSSERWPGWGTAIYGLSLVYLSIATGIIAGVVAWSTHELTAITVEARLPQRHLVLHISRCVIWVFSVFSQGLFVGLLLVSLTKDNCKRSPSSLSQELVLHSDRSSLKDRGAFKALSSTTTESQRPSIDRKTSCDDCLSPILPTASTVPGRRFSGRTLFQQDSKHSSVDFHSPGARKSSLEYGRLRNQSDAQRDSRDSSSIHAEDRPAPRKIQRTPSEIKRSLDSLMLQPSSGRTSPAASTIQVETPRMPPAPKLNLPADESNIHPLFRSNSVSPPPTPMPGTTLHASPAAGQTISVKTLSRVRSVNSLRSPGSRSRSPLFERMDHDGEMNQEQGTESRMDNQLKGEGGNAIPGFIMAADVRRSITRYEKRYDLHESPDES